MVENIFRDITSIAMAIIGVAILYTLVNRNNKTVDVIKASSSGFSMALATAMGANVSGTQFPG